MSDECLEIKPNTPFTEYYFDHEQFHAYAEKCKNLIDRFSVLEIYETRRHNKGKYACWYISFKGIRPERICFILQFEIRKSNATIGFRCADFAPKDRFKKTPSIINRGTSLDILYNHYTENELAEIIAEYLKQIEPSFKAGNLSCQKRHPCEDKRNPKSS